MGEPDSDPSLWEMLGIPRDSVLPELDDDAWDRVVHAAVDPAAPEVDDTLVPVHDPADDPASWSGDDLTDHASLDAHDAGGHHDGIGDLGWADDTGHQHDHGVHDHGVHDHDAHDQGDHDPGHDSGFGYGFDDGSQHEF
ncbi:hypothetical protein [Skermania sp. ID1734]|uniref:hypothetical protein n=1 Tax=Skermania sp. ID1734 TaxID=2597516 RepID=UPI0021056EE0|nr:hypothetical protein [Skermania sp. ID1734]